jgi:hypothetical protein
MSKTRRLLGASLIALAIGSISSAKAGFDRSATINVGLGGSVNAGAYNNPYLQGPNQPQPQQNVPAQPNGGFGFAPFMPFPGGGFNLNLPGMSGGVSMPWGGFGLPSHNGIPPFIGGFNIGPVGFSSPFGGFNLNAPGVSAQANTPVGGFGLLPFPFGGFSLNLPGMSGGVSTPTGGFGFNPFFSGGFGLNIPGASANLSTPFGGFNLGPVGFSSPFGGFGLNLPGASAHVNSPFGGFGFNPFFGFGLGQQKDAPAWSGFNLGPIGFSTPFAGFGLNLPGASAHVNSPFGGFGLFPFAFPGFNLGQQQQPAMTPMPSAPYGYAPYGYAPYGYPQQTGTAPAQTAPANGPSMTAQGVSCSINEVAALTRSVTDCEKAGGSVVAANTQ